MSSRKRVNEKRLEALLEGRPEGDEREHELARILHELRAETPSAPAALRERVRSLAPKEIAPQPSLVERLSLRRAVLVLAVTLVVAALGAAMVAGIRTAASGGDAVGEGASSESAGGGGDAGAESRGGGGGESAAQEAPPGQEAGEPLFRAQAPTAKTGAGASLPPSRRRAQDYRAFLRVRVDDANDLSRKTKEALRLTRDYGGYVVSANYGVGRQGDARLELRVPIGRIQDAVLRFSNLGTILEQRVSIRDLQGRIDTQTGQIVKLRGRIAKLQAALRRPNLTAEERERLEAELSHARETLTALRTERAGVARQARFADVALALTTRDPLAAGRDEGGRIERAFADARSVLVKEIAIGVYLLIVAAPFIVLGVLAFAAARAARRRADQRLLERA